VKIAASSSVEPAAVAQPRRTGWSRTALWFAVWLAAIALAGFLDTRLASRVYSSGVYQTVKYSLLLRAIKAPGNAWGLPFLVLMVWWLSRPSTAPAVLLAVTAALAGLFTTVAKWSVGRGRPIANGIYNLHPFRLHPFHGGLPGLFAPQRNQSFPSGHACLAFAIAGALSLWRPRFAVVFFVLAALVGVERLLEGAHYLSDVLAGGGLGIIAVVSATRICRGVRKREGAVHGGTVESKPSASSLRL
jgi:membrane-associated phospholipid phosphatase